MPLEKPLLICVIGPTAIGKTSLSIKIAKALNTEILSSDSRQFFKEMLIGTAVPDKHELEEVKHHFIHNKSIFDSYSVGDFEKEVLVILNELFSVRDVVVMVGGSGLYIDAVVHGLDEFPEVPSSIREQLNLELKEQGIQSLQKELNECDPVYFNEVDIQNPHRIIRALEIFRATGTPYSSYRTKNKSKNISERGFNTIFIGLSGERELVYNRINERVDQMISSGLINEAKMLHPYKDLNALQTVGYKELFKYFEGHQSLEQAIDEIKMNTRRFAKRQETWFKKNDSINWFSYDTDPDKIISFLRKKLN